MSASPDFELACQICGAEPGVICDCVSFGEEADTKEYETGVVTPEIRICECGAEAVNSNFHSNWCPKKDEV